MKNRPLPRLLLALSAAATVLLGLCGCRTSAQDSSVPWSRPASWEGNLPGVGGGGR